MWRRARTATRPGAALCAALCAILCAQALLQSCSRPRAAFLAGDREDRAELAELFGLLDAAGRDEVQRFAALRQISSKLLERREYGRLAALLVREAGRDRGPYAAWYLFTAAYAYELAGSAPVAAIYYDRIVKDLPDIVVDGRSVHYECLSRLIETARAPERRIEYYKDLIARFPSEADMGRALFLLGREYEAVGDWDLAVKAYSKFLPYFGSAIPGHPEAFQHARNVVDFYNSPKDWTYAELPALVANVKSALAQGDPARLRRYRAKVNFFAVSWHQDETDANSQVLFDFSEFMSGGRIHAADELDPGSGPREAYLRTWGWSERISTWYLYFRKIYFPADPEIHGRWEWAGIYFGEKMR
ncbi:MAG TPA: tetratricopeptide repeat protein [Spirochaetales bacterium]|nr:tetratricopeptide repeat protein [Spirochaetales bacterium]HRY55401.1 tetratricopeptide repeat protein [Spirochaetia bacterium]